MTMRIQLIVLTAKLLPRLARESFGSLVRSRRYAKKPTLSKLFVLLSSTLHFKLLQGCYIALACSCPKPEKFKTTKGKHQKERQCRALSRAKPPKTHKIEYYFARRQVHYSQGSKVDSASQSMTDRFLEFLCFFSASYERNFKRFSIMNLSWFSSFRNDCRLWCFFGVFADRRQRLSNSLGEDHYGWKPIGLQVSALSKDVSSQLKWNADN